jgi:ferredoxin-2, mitochondrial
MIRIRFVSADGTKTIETQAPPGTILLDLAQNNDQPLEGTCEGQMACSTCHVIIDAADFPKLPRASDDEEDMLDLAAGVSRTSRLACQIVLDDSLGGLTVRIPGESRNMQGR